ncbi:hypothetical protein [Herbidospora cretacea]|uniref:hypothetical protein n=1 Tax=Herbidospora cretacea TaxID=28444 RepID=UPI000B041205|nr:hypothetical protein [Herbidospora cretacea]
MRSLLLSAVALSFGLALAPAPAATADDIGDVVCHGGSIHLRFDPGLKFTRDTVRLTGTGDVGICSSVKRPALTGGTVRVEGVITGGCPGPIGPGYAKMTITWNDDTTTTVGQSMFRGEMSQFGLEGGVVSTGPFAGGTARVSGRTTSSLIELGAACVLTGATSLASTIDRLTVGAA